MVLGVALGVLPAGAVSAAPILTLDLIPAFPGINPVVAAAPGGVRVAELLIVGVEPSEPVNAFELDLVFDDAVVSLENVALGSFLAEPSVEVENTVGAGRLGLAAATVGPGAAFGDGLLATLTFRAIAGGASTLVFENVLLSQPGGVAIGAVDLVEGAGIVVIPEARPGILVALGTAALGSRRRRRP